MRVLLREIVLENIDFGSLSLFENINSLSRVSKNSQIYEKIIEFEKKLNWLTDLFPMIGVKTKTNALNNYGYVSILNTYLKIDDSHIILLCFCNNEYIGNAEIKKYNLNKDLCDKFMQMNIEYKEVYTNYFREIAEDVEYDTFIKNFNEVRFNDCFFSNFIYDRQGKYEHLFYRNLYNVFSLINQDFEIILQEALKTGILDLSVIPYLYGFVFEIPNTKVTEIKIKEIDDQVSLNTKIFEDSDININIARIGSESVWDFTDCEDEGRWSFRQKIVNQKYEEIPIKIEED